MSNKKLSEGFFQQTAKSPKSPRSQRRKPVSAGVGFSSMRRGLLLGAGASVVALAGFGVMVQGGRPDFGPEIPGKLRIVLIDSSDRNTAVQDRLISRVIEQSAIQDLVSGDRLILLGLSADQFEPLEERFNQVSPPRAADRSAWTNDLARLEDDWKTDFHDAYIKEARDLRDIFEKKQTPFLEALMQINSILQQYEADDKSVIIVSDALQHISGGLSAYTNDPARAVLGMPDKLAGFYRPQFAGAKVKLIHILRNKTLHWQGDDHRAWIDQVFAGQGAEFEYVGLS